MADPGVTDGLTQDVKDAQAKFDAGMGADGDASPYPMLNELRAKAPVHAGWPEMGIFDNPEEGQHIFSAYTFDAVKAVFTDNKTFSTRCYEAIVRPLQGPTRNRSIRFTAGCTNSPSPVRRCGGGRPSWSARWWNAPSSGCATPSARTWSRTSSCRSRSGSSRR
jgi:hypothetical protein